MKKSMGFVMAASLAMSLGCDTINAQLAGVQKTLEEDAAKRNGATSSSTKKTKHEGPITFKNASSQPVCEVQLDGDAAAVVGEVKPGATVQLAPQPEATRIWVGSCERDGIVAGNLSKATALFPDGIVYPTIVLHDAGAQSDADEHAVFVEPQTFEAAYNDMGPHLVKGWSAGTMASFTAEALAALRAYAAAKRYPEEYLTLQLTSAEWEINRDRRDNSVKYRHIAGLAIARFPVGKCILYPVAFLQRAEGNGFATKLESTGAGGGVQVPCAMAAWAAVQPHTEH